MDLFKSTRLSYLKAEKYEHLHSNICDFSTIPRPHSCMGLILSGEAKFQTKNDTVIVKKGDIIFVPITSEYISYWQGTPEITYISLHFIFDTPNGLFLPKKPSLQKVSDFDFGEMKIRYEYILKNLNSENEEDILGVLSRFYEILGIICPSLVTKEETYADDRISAAIEYIEKNFALPLSVPELAVYSKMSVSGFYSSFKKATGLTPVDYKNLTCVKYAMRMLIDDANYSIEEISGKLGFSSAAYFRRVFKSITGKTPGEYRRSSKEL